MVNIRYPSQRLLYDLFKSVHYSKILCAVSYILPMLNTMYNVYGKRPYSFESPNDPVAYFRFVGAVFSFIFQFIVIKRFWWNSADFLDVVNTLQFTKWQGGKLQRRSVITFVFCLYTLAPIYGFLHGVGGPEWSKQIMKTCIISTGTCLSSKPTDWKIIGSFICCSVATFQE